MGFRFRKSINIGGFRVNVSKSGVGYSYGVKGARVTRTATGKKRTTLSVPGTGISYVTESGSKKKKVNNSNNDQQPQSPTGFDQNAPICESTENLDLANCQSGQFQDFIHEISQVLKLNLISTVLICTLILSAMPFFIFTGVAGIAMKIYVHTKKKIQITYDFDESSKQEYDKLYNAWMKLNKNNKVWQIMSAANNVDAKQNAGASRLVTRRPASATDKLPWFLESNISPFGLKLGRKKLLFLPDKVLVIDGTKVGAIDYSSLSIQTGTRPFIETDPVPSDAEIAGYTWSKVNKNGSPDKRFKNNKQLPQCIYGQVCINSIGGLQVEIMCSNNKTILNFRDAAMQAASLRFAD